MTLAALAAGGLVLKSSQDRKHAVVLQSAETNNEYFDTLGPEGEHYTHCKVCSAGILIQDKEGVVRCTYCGSK